MNKLTVETSYARLFPGKKLDYEVRVKFSKKFSPYNANIRKIGHTITLNFSHEWKRVNKEISIGLVQELLLKILNKKTAATTNMDLYSHFVKNLHLSANTTERDEKLEVIFNRVNAKYFHNIIELPNLKWGLTSRTKLATYDYHTDTINVSNVFMEADEDIVSYLLYHEMLHKKLKFKNSAGRSIHHSRQFKEMEKAFENQQYIEKRLQHFLNSKGSKLTSWINKII